MQNYDLKEDIREFWSKQAAHFDSEPAHKIEERYGMLEWHKMLRKRLELGPSGTLEGTQILDIACGTGEISKVLCAMGGTVVGIDFSQAMLQVAAHKLEGATWEGLHTDAETSIILEDDRFDLAITRHLCWTLTAPQTAYENWFRVLKPKGRLLVIDGNWAQSPSWWQRFQNWLADRIDTHQPTDAVDSQRHAHIMDRLPYSGGLGADRLRADLTKAGFVQITEFEIGALYTRGMRALRIAERLRQTSENRFGLIAQKPAR